MALLRHTTWRVLLATALFLLALTASASAANFQVTSTDGGTGTCPSADSCTLRTAIADANANSEADTINVPAGTYTLTTANGGELPIDSDMTILGDPAGGTIIDGSDQVRGFFISTTGSPALTVKLQDLTVQHGLGDTTCSTDGGGVFSAGAALTLTRVAIRNSAANFDGGGLMVEGSLQDNCSSALPASVGHGATGPTPSLTIDHSEISENSSGTSSGLGGGIATFGVPATITNTTIAGNTTAQNGGGIEFDSSDNLLLQNDTIARNTVTNANQCSDASPNCVGAGVHATLSNLTGSVPAITVSSVTEAQNTVLAYNTVSFAPALFDPVRAAAAPQTINCSGVFSKSDGYNIADDSTCGLGATGDLQGTDPKLAALALNSPGTTRTMAIDTTSPAFDHIPVGATCPLTDDQRGVSRPQANGCDSGAFELVVPPAPRPASPPAPTPVVAQAPVVVPAGPSLRLAGVRAGCAGATVTVRVRATVPGGVRNVKVTLGSKIIKNTKSRSFTLWIRAQPAARRAQRAQDRRHRRPEPARHTARPAHPLPGARRAGLHRLVRPARTPPERGRGPAPLAARLARPAPPGVGVVHRN